MMKIFPCRNIAGKTLEWYSQSDQLPQDMDNDKWVFIRKSMSYVNEMIVMKKYNDACLLLEKIKKYQQKECDGLLSADNKFKAEKIYNQFDYSKSVAMACICIGLICFIYYCHCMASQKRTSRKAIIILNILLWIVFTYLSAAICLRGYVSNHLPLSNGFETMQFMAWCTLLLTFLLQRKIRNVAPFRFPALRTYADGIHAGRIKPTNHTTDAGSAISIIEYPRSSYHDRLFAAGIYHAEWCNSGHTPPITERMQRTNRTIADNKPNNSLSGNFLTRYRYFHWCCMGKRIMGTLLGMGS